MMFFFLMTWWQEKPPCLLTGQTQLALSSCATMCKDCILAFLQWTLHAVQKLTLCTCVQKPWAQDRRSLHLCWQVRYNWAYCWAALCKLFSHKYTFAVSFFQHNIWSHLSMHSRLCACVQAWSSLQSHLWCTLWPCSGSAGSSKICHDITAEQILPPACCVVCKTLMLMHQETTRWILYKSTMTQMQCCPDVHGVCKRLACCGSPRVMLQMECCVYAGCLTMKQTWLYIWVMLRLRAWCSGRL